MSQLSRDIEIKIEVRLEHLIDLMGSWPNEKLESLAFAVMCLAEALKESK